MKVAFIIATIVLAAATGAGAYALRRSLAPAPPAPVAPPVADPAAVPAVGPDHPTWSDPEPLRGIVAWEGSRRLKVVGELQGDAALAPEILTCLRRLIRDKAFRPVVRNGMANCLVDQRAPDPELHRLFAAMYDDPAEDPVWRDYCVQFLGCCLPTAGDREAVVAKLQRIATTDGTATAGTALLHLVINDAAGELKLPDDFHLRITESLWRESTPEPTKLSILGLLGATGDAAHLPAVRRMLTEPSSTTALRGALGALGRLGTAADLPAIRPYLSHENRAVVLAAEAARDRLAQSD